MTNPTQRLDSKQNGYAARYAKEKLTNQVEIVIRAILPNEPLREVINARTRLLEAGITQHQAEELLLKTRTLNEKNRKRVLTLNKWNAPIETIINFISAPEMRNGQENTPVREEIFNQISSNQKSAKDVIGDGGLARPLYLGAFLAASSSSTLLATRVASLNDTLAWYVKPLTLIFDSLENALPGIANAIGQDAASMISAATPGGSATLLGFGLLAALWQRNKAKTKHANLAGELNAPAAGIAQDLFCEGQESRIWSRYQRLTEGQKHLLSHLSPHELRVFLIGGPQAAREVIASRPISYQQQVHALAHDCNSYFEFLGKMMEMSLPERLKASARNTFDRFGWTINEPRLSEQVVDAVHSKTSVANTAEVTSVSMGRPSFVR